MDEDQRATAKAVAAKREIDSAIADLAASPGHVPTADQMRAVLRGVQLRKARKTLTRMPTSKSQGALSVVEEQTEESEDDAASDHRLALGGVA